MRTRLRHQFRALIRANHLRDRRVELLAANERVPPDSLLEFQAACLRRTLTAARRRLGAYWDLAIPDDNIFQYLSHLPIVSKRDLLTEKSSYAPRLALRRLWTPRGLTSGTTGTPLQTFRSLNSVVWESAFVQRYWTWSGFESGMRRATLRGDNVVPASRSEGPFWYFNKAENQLLVSSRHLRKPYIDAIAEELQRFSPYLLQAYPSTAFELARHLERNDAYLTIPFVYTSSEVLYPYQRELISSRLRTRIMDQYGMAERVAFVTECERGNYHVNSDYSHVELVDDEGMPTNEIGYIVGTTYHNLTMPLIRYRLSDRTSWKPGSCMCGRTYPMVEPIKGKFEDTVYGSTGDPVSPSLITFAFKGLKNIERSQVAQVANGHWEVRVVPSAGFGRLERTALIRNIRELVDPNINVTVVEYQDIPRTEAGKYRWVVNECAT